MQYLIDRGRNDEKIESAQVFCKGLKTLTTEEC